MIRSWVYPVFESGCPWTNTLYPTDLEERYHIQVMRKQGKSLRSIAIGRGRSHVPSRELRRNQGIKAIAANRPIVWPSAPSERSQVKKLTRETQDYIQEKIRLRWSPEQACGRLPMSAISLSPEPCRYLLKDRQRGGDLSSFLRHRQTLS